MLLAFEARVHQSEGDEGVVCTRVDEPTKKAKEYFPCTKPIHGRYLEVKPTDSKTILACHLIVSAHESEHFVPYYFIHFVNAASFCLVKLFRERHFILSCESILSTPLHFVS